MAPLPLQPTGGLEHLHYVVLIKVTFFRNGVFSGGQLDLKQLLGSLPVDNLPPFMQTLVSSLTHLTTQVRYDLAFKLFHCTGFFFQRTSPQPLISNGNCNVLGEERVWSMGR